MELAQFILMVSIEQAPIILYTRHTLPTLITSEHSYLENPIIQNPLIFLVVRCASYVFGMWRVVRQRFSRIIGVYWLEMKAGLLRIIDSIKESRVEQILTLFVSKIMT